MTSLPNEILPPESKELIPSLSTSVPKYDVAVAASKERDWETLGKINVGQALEIWLADLHKLTAINYRSGMKQLISLGFLNTSASFQSFALTKHNSVIARIKKHKAWSECTRQARAACYISFTRYWSLHSDGMIKRAIPSREGSDKTFYRVRKKVKKEAMKQSEWIAFLDELLKINARDCLIAKLTLQGGKRINEVLGLTVDKINWEKNEITFSQSKTKGSIEVTIITYPTSIMEELRGYICDRKGLVFVTKNLKRVPVLQVANTFEKAGKNAKIPFPVSPHTLRATLVTFLKQQGFADSDIMNVTGHSSSEMINAYDKSSPANNATKKISLVK